MSKDMKEMKIYKLITEKDSTVDEKRIEIVIKSVELNIRNAFNFAKGELLYAEDQINESYASISSFDIDNILESKDDLREIKKKMNDIQETFTDLGYEGTL